MSVLGIPKKVWGYIVAAISGLAALLAAGFVMSRKRVTRQNMASLPDPKEVAIPDVDLSKVESTPLDDYQEETKAIKVDKPINSVIDDLNNSFE